MFGGLGDGFTLQINSGSFTKIELTLILDYLNFTLLKVYPIFEYAVWVTSQTLRHGQFNSL